MVQKRTCVVFAAFWLWFFCGTGFGADNTVTMARPINWKVNKNMSLALNWDYHAYTDTDFFDFWGVDDQPANMFLPGSLSYEIKFWENIGFEVTAGYAGFDDDTSDQLEEDDSVSIDMQTYYLLFSAKYYWRLNSDLYLFGGIGMDIHFVDGEIDYAYDGESYNMDYSRTLFGGHACLGAEYFILKGAYPLSVDLQYKYTYLQSDDVDQELISAINDDTDSSYSSKDLNLSGHTVSLSFKLHF